MTNINNLKNKEIKTFTDKEAAVNFFQKQKADIQLIADTEGFKAIRDFWQLQYDKASNELDLIDLSKIELLAETRANKLLAKHFLNFLDTRLIKEVKNK